MPVVLSIDERGTSSSQENEMTTNLQNVSPHLNLDRSAPGPNPLQAIERKERRVVAGEGFEPSTFGL